MTFKKTLIIGLGLIGGSFARAIKTRNLSAEIFAHDIDKELLEFARDERVIDGGFDNLDYFADELANFDLIVVASPLSSYENIFAKLSKKASPSAIIIDLGSIKDLKINNLPANFIPCHPIAGSQNSGFEHSSADLFLDKKFIICLKNPAAKKIAELAKAIGSKVEFLDAKKHDEIYALISHLPLFLSFLTKEFSPKNIKDPFFQNAFRLDNSNPDLWFNIFAMNKKNLEKFYLIFFENLKRNITFNPESPLNEFEAIDTVFDEKFLVDNFAAIFFRALVVKSYLEIPEIKSYQNYGGSGFKDFTSTIEITNFDQEKLIDLAEKNREKILKIFNSIT